MIYIPTDLVSRVKYAREAANVHRTHATPPVQPYQVGMHSFGMLCLLRILYPDAPRSLIWAILEHDVPERTTCDMSHPAKIMGLLNKDKQAHFENSINEAVFGADSVCDISDEDLKWLKGLDMLEFYCWCRDQLMIGNRTVNTQKVYVEGFMDKNKHLFPKEVTDLFYQIMASDWETLPDMEF